MREFEDISELSDRIWKSCIFLPTLKDVIPFENALEQVNFKNLIVHNYHSGKSGLALNYLWLSTFKFWKHFNNGDWKEIFLKLKDNSIAKYDITSFCFLYLGVKPNFKSDGNAFSKSISHEKWLSSFHLDLEVNFGLAIQDLIDVKKNLVIQINQLPKQKSFWKRLFE
jgi:hypothetical protein